MGMGREGWEWVVRATGVREGIYEDWLAVQYLKNIPYPQTQSEIAFFSELLRQVYYKL